MTAVTVHERIDLFLSEAPHAVVGASRDRSKYGNKVLRTYLQTSRRVYPVNPHADTVEGLQAYPNLAAVPETLHGISIITPPDVTAMVVAEAGELGIRQVWMQPGAESDAAIQLAQSLGMNVLAGGPCLLVALGFRE